MSTLSSSCSEVEILANNFGFKVLLCSISFVSFAAIIAEVSAIKWITLRMALHENIKILIVAHQISLILHCISRIEVHVSDVIVFSQNHKNPCDYLSTATRCYLQRATVTITLFLNACSVVGMVFERAIATLFSDKYERMGKSVAIAIIAIEVTISTLLFAVGTISANMFGNMPIAVYCTSFRDTNRDRVLIVLGISFAIDAFSATSLPFLLAINKNLKKNQITTNLSHRYQMNENIASIKTLLPIIILQSAVYGIFMFSLFSYVLFTDKWTETGFAITAESVQLTPVYALVFPLVLIYVRRLVKNRANQSLQTNISVSRDDAEKYYFGNLFSFPAKRSSTPH